METERKSSRFWSVYALYNRNIVLVHRILLVLYGVLLAAVCNAVTYFCPAWFGGVLSGFFPLLCLSLAYNIVNEIPRGMLTTALHRPSIPRRRTCSCVAALFTFFIWLSGACTSFASQGVAGLGLFTLGIMGTILAGLILIPVLSEYCCAMERYFDL